MVPTATVGVDLNNDGEANIYVTGVDMNNDGIPDVLQQGQQSTGYPSTQGLAPRVISSSTPYSTYTGRFAKLNEARTIGVATVPSTLPEARILSIEEVYASQQVAPPTMPVTSYTMQAQAEPVMSYTMRNQAESLVTYTAPAQVEPMVTYTMPPVQEVDPASHTKIEDVLDLKVNQTIDVIHMVSKMCEEQLGQLRQDLADQRQQIAMLAGQHAASTLQLAGSNGDSIGEIRSQLEEVKVQHNSIVGALELQRDNQQNFEIQLEDIQKAYAELRQAQSPLNRGQLESSSLDNLSRNMSYQQQQLDEFRMMNADELRSHTRSLEGSLSNLRTDLQEQITDLRAEMNRLRGEQSRAVMASNPNIDDLVRNLHDLEEQQRQHAQVLGGLQCLEPTLVQRIEMLLLEQRQEIMSYGLAPGKFENLEREVSILVAGQTECHSSVKDISSCLEQEITDRCSLNIELHALVGREVASLRADIASAISERAAANQEFANNNYLDFRAEREEIMRTLQAEHDGRLQDTGDLRTSMEDLKSEVVRNLQTERSSRSHDGVMIQQEFTRALDDERDARIQQVRDIYSELAKSISKEREDRICENSDQRREISRAIGEWHNRRRMENGVPEERYVQIETPSSRSALEQQTPSSRSALEHLLQ